MSVFSNPATRSIDDAHAYTTAILKLLGDRDPVGVLRDTLDTVRAAVAGVSDAQLRQHEAAGKWSIAQVVQHLADAELVTGYRLRLVLSQHRPPLTGYDQDRWAERLHYDQADVRLALDEFSTLRRANLRLLERASRDDFTRVGVHAERGEESVDRMVRLCAGHDLLHLAQLERIRRAVAE
jgi:uncharacterized damage-inducible protein DinB